MVFDHCRVLYRDKQVKGVSVLATSVFFSWGLWNLYYYPHLDQWLSFLGGLVIVAGNLLWLSMMFYYGKAEDNRRPAELTNAGYLHGEEDAEEVPSSL